MNTRDENAGDQAPTDPSLTNPGSNPNPPLGAADSHGVGEVGELARVIGDFQARLETLEAENREFRRSGDAFREWGGPQRIPARQPPGGRLPLRDSHSLAGTVHFRWRQRHYRAFSPGIPGRAKP